MNEQQDEKTEKLEGTNEQQNETNKQQNAEKIAAQPKNNQITFSQLTFLV
jgi:hypothetical protein